MPSCATCKKEFVPKESRTDRKVGVYCSRHCLGKRNKFGENNPKWRGGRSVRKDGRAVVYAPGHPNSSIHGGTHILEYRLIMSKHLGRVLLETELVHHKNGDPSDNRIENLEIMTLHEHNVEHIKTRTRCPKTGRLVSEK